MSRNTVVVNFSAPPALAKQIMKQAKKENKTKSAFLRTTFESYMFEKKLKEIQVYGRVIAEKLGLESYDDIEEYLG
ncbi:hypothetical protein KKB40_00285 [Patescibacteria group bacterium]|nr:hypothetical protein [Patescibacteria group bacterium]